MDILCESTNSCHVKDCNEKHHTTLHEHFTSPADPKDGVTGDAMVITAVAVRTVSMHVTEVVFPNCPCDSSGREKIVLNV